MPRSNLEVNQPMPEKLVIVGNGMAPGRMLEHLLEAAPGRYEVTIFNAEPRVNYDRIMLSPVLTGEKAFEQIIIHGDGWYIKNGITLYKGHKITAIDRVARTVTSDRGVVQFYDKLVIATGSVPSETAGARQQSGGVLTYRDLDDVNAMLLAAQSRAKAVVIGGGLLGLEAAAGLKAQDMDVTVLHLMPTLMERQLDPAAGYLLQRSIEARGINVITKASTKAILGERKVEGVELADGRSSRDARRDGGRHPPKHRFGKGSGPRHQPGYSCRGRYADIRSLHSCRRRMCGSWWSGLWPCRAAL